MRDLGKLPDELEIDGGGGERMKRAQLERLRERQRLEKLERKGGKRKKDPAADAENVLAPSVGGVAQDYAEFTQEFVHLLMLAEGTAVSA